MPTNPSAGPAARSTSSRLIPTGNLNSFAFAPYGQVIQNPAHHPIQPTGLQKTVANQGSATKWLDVTNMTNWYDRAVSRTPAKVVVNMFVCQPRDLRQELSRDERSSEQKEKKKKLSFPVKILERHPYTPQTFIPLGVQAADKATRYLVIVAPTLPPQSEEDDGRANNRDNNERNTTATSSPDTIVSPPPPPRMQPKGPGKPDLDHLQAFIAQGDQAVTYGPGTWHAPMVVLGEKDIDFVVVQFANGVGHDDCQEFDVMADIAVDVGVDDGRVEASALGIMRAKI